MSLLTLNKTTLFYYFLSDRISYWKEKFSTGINNWAEDIPDDAVPADASGSGRISQPLNPSESHIPALTNTTGHSSSSTSVLSQSIIKISQNIKVKAKPHDASVEINEFGLEDDHDKMMGVEREAALKSPPKGKPVF